MMKGLVVLALLFVSGALASDGYRCGTCPPTDPPGPTVLCPSCVNGECSPDMCNQAVGIPYPGDCTKFCICDSAGAVEMACPQGTVWDNANKICNWPDQAHCSNSNVNPGCTNPTVLPTLPCSNPPEGDLVYCPPCVNAWCSPDMCNQAVGVPFPGDCNKFCICDSAGAIQMQCPTGLIWDNVNKICNWPTDATCPSSWPGC